MTPPAGAAESGAPAPADLRAALGLRFLGHATVLLELPAPAQAAAPGTSPLRLLTDPFLRDRLGPLRRHGPVPDAADIGPVDVVLVSHAHPDHFDRRSLEALEGDPLVIVPSGMGRLVTRCGRRVREVAIGEPVVIGGGRTVTAVPARHWRWPGAPRAATVGFLIEEAARTAATAGAGPTRGGIYFAGDTAPYPGMRVFADRVDIALLPVGSWGPHVSPGHLTPRSAAAVARDLGARVAVPIHWGTLYPPYLERWMGGRLTEPATRFVEWAARLAPGLDVRPLRPGEATTIETGTG